MYSTYPATCVPVHYRDSLLTSQGIHIQLGRVFTTMPPLLWTFSKTVQYACILRLIDDEGIRTRIILTSVLPFLAKLLFGHLNLSSIYLEEVIKKI